LTARRIVANLGLFELASAKFSLKKDLASSSVSAPMPCGSPLDHESSPLILAEKHEKIV
jgi:hypothetical protein